MAARNSRDCRPLMPSLKGFAKNFGELLQSRIDWLASSPASRVCLALPRTFFHASEATTHMGQLAQFPLQLITAFPESLPLECNSLIVLVCFRGNNLHSVRDLEAQNKDKSTQVLIDWTSICDCESHPPPSPRSRSHAFLFI